MPDASQADLRAEARSRTRADRTDRILSASAGVAAISALLVSVYQAYITRQQQKMSAWPYVIQQNTGGDTSYAWRVANAGLGPALVRHMTVTVDGKPVPDWGTFLETTLRADSAQIVTRLAGTRTTTSSIRRGTVLLPASTTELIRTEGPFGLSLRRLLNDDRVKIEVCYCSLYDDCWLSSSGATEPEAVRACPAGDDFRS